MSWLILYRMIYFIFLVSNLVLWLVFWVASFNEQGYKYAFACVNHMPTTLLDIYFWVLLFLCTQVHEIWKYFQQFFVI